MWRQREGEQRVWAGLGQQHGEAPRCAPANNVQSTERLLPFEEATTSALCAACALSLHQQSQRRRRRRKWRRQHVSHASCIPRPWPSATAFNTSNPTCAAAVRQAGAMAHALQAPGQPLHAGAGHPCCRGSAIVELPSCWAVGGGAGAVRAPFGQTVRAGLFAGSAVVQSPGRPNAATEEMLV
jgi:hypothetical protein